MSPVNRFFNFFTGVLPEISKNHEYEPGSYS
jgi:hypothetical protein